MDKVEVMLLMADDQGKKLPALQKRLAAAGLEQIACLESLGTITGTIEESKITKLQNIPGIVQVERSGSITLSPPNSPVQ